ncbi:glycosyltransferase family 2 protein [Maribacter flavus]|uniref:Glycosyltransferase family 2 protein n=1 Tax=Maribacter flavus TaxID=1658664 RepID=A0A5B2TMV6_9FLAO|nr:glycosyltransferase family A protein [Maribacter flavus]KAA2215807.1 glycosyltransferase family 2 protein [Maribacter flavus]
MDVSDVTVIITVWKRPYLDLQLKSLINQVIKPKEIWIIHNENYIETKNTSSKYRDVFPNISVIHSEINLKYFGRFSICYNVKTRFTLIIDDDVIPSSQWIKICLEKSGQYNAIISCTGRIIRPKNYRPEEFDLGNKNEILNKYFIGDNYNEEEYNCFPEDTVVDYGCNSYFFKTEWIRNFWRIWPATFDSGEDIHLSATLKILKSIPTIVPKQNIDTSGNLKKKFSVDQYSSCLHEDFIDVRQKVFEYLINEQGWRPILWNKTIQTD